MTKIERMKELISYLDECCKSYYLENKQLISDYEYDQLYDELEELEKETSVVFSNSPTHSVGYEVKDYLQKVIHSHPMMSLDKTKNVKDLVKFINQKDYVLSAKADGLTLLLTYDDGKLMQAETRGNGTEGELVTHNARFIENIPLTIEHKEKFEIEGEAIITYEDFELINSKIKKEEDKYKNPRNLASGSIRQLDSEVAAKRHIKFIAWKVPTDLTDVIGHKSNEYYQRLEFAKSLGFEIIPHMYTNDVEHIEWEIENIKNMAEKMSLPIDGLVCTYNDISYGESLGSTSKFPRHSYAFKFYDEEVETKVLDIDWTMGKTGRITPTLIFEPVEIGGTSINKASLHHLTIFKDFKLSYGDRVLIYKANQIIPQVSENLDKDTYLSPEKIPLGVPIKCPICGQRTEVIKENDTEVLVCSNDMCDGKLLGKLKHFVSKAAMDIVGLSEQTLEKFIDERFIESFIDIYKLKAGFYNDIVKMDGFGKRSTDKLMEAIEKSKDVTLDKFINALSIPMVGSSTAKDIAKSCDYDWNIFYGRVVHEYDWRSIDGIGKTIADNIWQYMNDNIDMVEELASYMRFQKVEKKNNTVDLSGITFVITGFVEHFKNRNELKAKIEELGGKVVGSVSNKTDYLINNDNASNSSKNKKAKELFVPIITEEEFIKMIQ